MVLIAYHIIDKIFNNLKIEEQVRFCLVNKRYFNKYGIFLNKVRLIQNYYKNNRPCVPEKKGFDRNFRENYWPTFTKNLLVRQYIASYPMEYLKVFPENLINKTHKPELLQWLVDNTPRSVEERSRRHVRNFLMLDDITKEDILYTGW